MWRGSWHVWLTAARPHVNADVTSVIQGCAAPRGGGWRRGGGVRRAIRRATVDGGGEKRLGGGGGGLFVVWQMIRQPGSPGGGLELR